MGLDIKSKKAVISSCVEKKQDVNNFNILMPFRTTAAMLVCWGPASAGSRGYPQDERSWREREKTRETSLDRTKSAREREREKERERERVTKQGVQSLAESGNALFFTIAFIP